MSANFTRGLAIAGIAVASLIGAVTSALVMAPVAAFLAAVAIVFFGGES